MSRSFTNTIKMIKRLQEGDATIAELKEHSGYSDSTLRRWLEVMRKERLVYVSFWEKSKNGVPIPSYSWGDEPDVRKPPKYTEAERQRHYRQRRERRRQELLMGWMREPAP